MTIESGCREKTANLNVSSVDMKEESYHSKLIASSLIRVSLAPNI